jgi:hypothetical protein
VNGANGILKTSITYFEKTIIWIQNFKIGILTKEKQFLLAILQHEIFYVDPRNE